MNKKVIIIVLIIIALGVGAYFYFKKKDTEVKKEESPVDALTKAVSKISDESKKKMQIALDNLNKFKVPESDLPKRTQREFADLGYSIKYNKLSNTWESSEL